MVTNLELTLVYGEVWDSLWVVLSTHSFSRSLWISNWGSWIDPTLLFLSGYFSRELFPKAFLPFLHWRIVNKVSVAEKMSSAAGMLSNLSLLFLLCNSAANADLPSGITLYSIQQSGKVVSAILLTCTVFESFPWPICLETWKVDGVRTYLVGAPYANGCQ